jgi:hypothetical protein
MKTSFARLILLHALILCVSIVCPHPVRADEPVEDHAPPPLPGAEHYPLYDHIGPAVESTFLPAGDLFKRLLAAPKERRFYLSYRRYSFQNQNINAAAGGFGEIFGLYRRFDREKGSGWQVNFGGGIHSLFNLDAPSRALVNTDYIIGFPCSFRQGPDSYRLMLYHQSSHLGDEYLLATNVNRIELSYEAINFIASREWREWRGYYGGEYLVHKVPSNLDPASLQAGVEYYGSDAMVGRGRPVGGLDLKSYQEHDWAVNSSLRLGLQFDSAEPNGRYIRILAEGYMGFSPHGQFYTYRTYYYGIGVYFGFE